MPMFLTGRGFYKVGVYLQDGYPTVYTAVSLTA